MTAAPSIRVAVPPVLDPQAFTSHDPAATVADMGGATMGTYWRVRLAAPPGFDRDAAKGAVEQRLAIIVEEMSQWEPASLLSRFNHASAGRWTDLPDDFSAVIAAALDIAARTQGAFDPTMGRLTDLHGFGATPLSTPPTPEAVAQALALSGWRRLAYEPAARRLTQPGGLWLDFAGIAKGHAVDMTANLLGAMGIRHCMVEIGGECVGRGIRPDGDPWWVELECPPDLDLPPLRLALHQLAIATSGNYVRGDHTLDPRTGYPARNGIASASVIHTTAMQADAWATAITVLGPQDGAALATREGLAARIVTQEGAAAREWLSPALQAMLDG